MIAISGSEMTAWTRCRRNWLTLWFLGYRPASEAVTGPMQLGNRVHLAMQAKYGHGLDPVAVIILLYKIEIEHQPEHAAELAREAELARIMVEGHEEAAAAEGWYRGMQVLAAEQDVTTPLPGVPGVLLRAKLDLFGIDPDDGGLLFLDWKTAADFSAHEHLDQHPQFRNYALIQRLHALERGDPLVLGGRVTTLRRCKRTSTSKPPYYMSTPFRFNDDQMDAALRRARMICAEIMIAREALAGAYAEGLDTVNRVQRELLYPNWIERDCSWRCPLSSGLCGAMDDGADWGAMLVASGRWEQGDPYDYYAQDGLSEVRARMLQWASPAGSVGTDAQGDDHA